MKTIKYIITMVLVLVAVKACFYIKNGMATSPASDNLSGTAPAKEWQRLSNASVNEGIHSGFVRHNLGYGLSLDVPEDWYILTGGQVSQIEAAADDVYGGGPDKRTAFAANSSRDPNASEAQYRVSFVEKQFDENALQSATSEDLRAGCEDIYNSWLQNPPTPNPIGRPQCSVVMFNGKAALLTSYQRNGRSNSVWDVNIVQIPLANNGVMITFSNMAGSLTAEEAITRINSSLKF